MSQHDMVIDNAPRPTVRADITAMGQALASTSKGNARPSTVYAGQMWIDDNTPSSSVWSVYFYDGSDDIKVGEIDSSGNNFMPFVNGTSVLASPAFTGNPTAPTQSAGNNTTRLATTAFVQTALAGSLASPTFTGTPAAPTAAPGTNTTQIATTAFVQTALASGLALARVTFNGTGSVSVLSSSNVSSITDNGAGDYTINFTSTLSSANYTPAGMAQEVSGNPANVSISSSASPTTSALRINVQDDVSALVDSPRVCVTVF